MLLHVKPGSITLHPTPLAAGLASTVGWIWAGWRQETLGLQTAFLIRQSIQDAAKANKRSLPLSSSNPIAWLLTALLLQWRPHWL